MDPLAAQQYCLRWNNHQNNLLTVFEDLLNNEAFVDVTLACDGMQLKAHKMVLSACSPYFQSLLFSTPDRHPIVFLKDVKFVEMKALLEFMYRGEVSIDQDRLSSLLKVAENLRIKGLAEVSCDQRVPKFPVVEDFSPTHSSTAQKGPHPNIPLTPLTPLAIHSAQHFGIHHPFGLISAHNIESVVGNSLVNRLTSSTSPPPSSSGHTYLGPKRKRGRPRRLSGSEAVPMASGIPENGTAQNRNHPEDMRIKVEQRSASESGIVSPGERASSEASSDSQSIDQNVAGSNSPKKEHPQIWSPSDCTKPSKGKPEALSEGSSAIKSLLNAVPENPMEGRMRPEECFMKLNDKLKMRDEHQLQMKQEPMELTVHSKMDGHYEKSLSGSGRHHPGSPKKSHQSDGQRKLRRENLHNIFKPKDHEDCPPEQQQLHYQPADSADQVSMRPMSSTRGMRVRGRGGRRGRHRGDRMGSRSMSEMSVRGLDLLRYAIVSPDGTFRCIECDRVQVSKHFKNKYSFQRHAFLYHEGAARKVFPCLVCHKEFSRPDKMKQHMKMSHEAASPSKAAPSPSPNSMAAALSAAVAAIGSTSAAALLVNSLQTTTPTNEVTNPSIKDPNPHC